ncbi:MAG: hypothetical protein RTU92_13960, partial [Candidatus Thorarchaeota archaeon]
MKRDDPFVIAVIIIMISSCSVIMLWNMTPLEFGGISILHNANSKLSQDSLTEVIGGPPANWYESYDSGFSEQGGDGIECSSGGYLLTCSIYDFEEKDDDWWIVRIDENRTMVWNQSFGGPDLDWCRSVVECASGGFAVVGETKSYGSGGTDVWLIRIDDDGNQLWNETYGGSGYDWGADIIQLEDGGFAIAGFTESYGSGTDDAWLIRTDENGTLLWHQPYGGVGYDRAVSIVQSDDGGFVLAGRYHVSDHMDVWLFKTTSTGSLVWSRTFGGSNWDQGYDLVQLGSSGYAVLGYTRSIGAGDRNVYLIRTDLNGFELWSEVYGDVGSDDGISIVNCSDDGFALLASTDGYNGNTLLIRTDSTGQALWAGSYGGSPSEIVYNSDGNFVIFRSGGILIIAEFPDSELFIKAESTVIVVEFGTYLAYHVQTYAENEITTWTVNNTANFTISNYGFLTSSIVLDAGVYPLTIEVEDTEANNASREFIVLVMDTIPPIWVETPTTQYYNGKSEFHYDLDAYDLSGVDEWELNNTDDFSIDFQGIIRNETVLGEGTYGLWVTAKDPHNNLLDAMFDVIMDTMIPQILGVEDFDYEFGTTDNTIEWICTDSNPFEFRIYENDSLIDSSTWSGSTILFNIDGLSIGVYNYT